MKKYISAFLLGTALVGMTSCEDWLNEEPQSAVTPENFFTSADMLAAYALNFYTMFPTHGDYTYNIGTFSLDNGTDNQVTMGASSIYYPANNLTPTGDGTYWSFTNIRNCNFFFDYVLPKYESGELSGSLVDEYIGEMYFFRAYSYWVNYKQVGDFPIITTVLPDDQETLMEYSVRYPRNLVARQILDDLSKAIQLLPQTATGGKQRLNKACAQLLRSRVALFEGTWLKYHKGTALVPGGPGWPGDASMLNGFNIDSEISYFLNEAMSSAEPVATAVAGNLASNDPENLADGYSPTGAILNQYYAMYTEQDLSSFAEVLLYRQYNTAQNQYVNIYMQLQRNGGGSGWTRGLVNSFVMQNGLPIYAAGSGYDPNWENLGVSKSLTDRDTRIQLFTKGDTCITSYNTDGTVERFQEGWLATGTSETRNVTGFAVKKGMIYSPNPGEHNHGVQGSIVFRATEAMLNYIEACVELNGTPNGTATNYWQAIRNRAHIDPDFNKTIGATNMSQEALGDWGAYSGGVLVDPTIYNVRRERRCELIGEGLRYDDLRRWRAMDQLEKTPYQIEGIKFWGTVYDISAGKNSLNLKGGDGLLLGMKINGEVVVDAGNGTDVIVDVPGGTGNMSEQSVSGDYVRPYQISNLNNPYFNGLTFTPALYLSPIGQSAFRKASPDGNVENSVIYQNPGWSKIGGDPVGPIN